MNRRLFTLLLLLSPITLLASDRDADTIKKLCADWDNAYIQKNAAPLETILHPDYIGIDEEGAVTKKTDEIALIKNSQYIINTITQIDPVDVRLYGATAIVHTHSKVNHTFKGKTDTIEGRSTIVCLKTKGHWQVLSWHASKVKE